MQNPLNIKLSVDDRENHFIENLSIPFEKTRLDIGDFIFKKYSEDNQEQVLCIIERKDINDLISSITDGRYREQKSRIIDHFTKAGILTIYLIENFDQNKHYSLDNNILNSCFVNCIVRDQIHVYHTRSKNDSIVFIEKLYSKFIEHSEKGTLFGLGKEKGHISTIQSVKSKNINPDNCLTLMLSQIPKVSKKKASSICDIYKNTASLITEYQKLDSVKDREKMLSSIDGIGKVLSKNVYLFLFGNSET